MSVEVKQFLEAFYLQLSGGEGKLGLCGGLGTFGGGNGGLFDSF